MGSLLDLKGKKFVLKERKISMLLLAAQIICFLLFVFNIETPYTKLCAIFGSIPAIFVSNILGI